MDLTERMLLLLLWSRFHTRAAIRYQEWSVCRLR